MIPKEICTAILDAINHPIVFVDNDHVIRFLNKAARQHYYSVRGYTDLVGRSLFGCHSMASTEQIIAYYNRLVLGENEITRPIANHNKKITVVAVRDSSGSLLGYYERFETIYHANPDT